MVYLSKPNSLQPFRPIVIDILVIVFISNSKGSISVITPYQLGLRLTRGLYSWMCEYVAPPPMPLRVFEIFRDFKQPVILQHAHPVEVRGHVDVGGSEALSAVEGTFVVL
jgi:hypothetical protein